MTPDEIERHESHLSEFSRLGGSLRADAPNASINNPAWFIDGDLTFERQQFHARVRAAFRDEQPNVLTDRKAIVLAGPPGAGKSSVLGQVIAAAGGSADQWRVIDADHFKDVLLREAIADGSYEGWLVPDDVWVLHDGGERFSPRELASLVHDESSQLSKGARADAIRSGDRIVLDTVLSNPDTAVRMGRMLERAGYEVTVVEVEVSLDVSRDRTRDRWLRGYVEAERGAAGFELGGRWVPSAYPESLFPNGAEHSTCLDAATRLATENGHVTRFERYQVVDPSKPSPEKIDVQVRLSAGSALLDERVALITQRALDGTASGRPRRMSPRTNRDPGLSR